MVTQGLRALMRANDPVKGEPLLAERHVSQMRPNYITQVEPFFKIAHSQQHGGKVTKTGHHKRTGGGFAAGDRNRRANRARGLWR